MELMTAGYLEEFEIVIGGYCSMACAELNNSWFYHYIEQKGVLCDDSKGGGNSSLYIRNSENYKS